MAGPGDFVGRPDERVIWWQVMIEPVEKRKVGDLHREARCSC